MADPRFSSALQTMTGMPDPLAPRTAKAAEQPKLQQTPLDRAYQEREQTTRALGNATTQLAEFEGMQQAQKAKTAAETAKGEFDLAEQRARDIEAPELRAERTRLRESMPKAFIPTQDNANDMATLFSLIGVIGFAVGAGGKGNAMAAMSAMNGMATGYQQGRMDLYAREKDKFETNVKALKTRIDAINDELDDVMQTAAVSYDKGLAKLKMVATKNDADFIVRYADKYGLPKAVEYLRSLDKSARDTVDRLEKEQARADERERDRLFRADQQRIMQEDRQQHERMMRAWLFDQQKQRDAEKQEGKVGLKPGDKKTEGYVADNQLLSDVGFMKQQLKDPELQQLVTQYRVEGFLSEEGGKAVSQLLSTEMPPKLRKFLTSVRDVRNNYYLTISGKAVTGGEALRNYGTVPQPGDSPDVMVDKMDALERRVAQKIELTRRLYPSLPPLTGTLPPLQPTNLRPNEDYSRETTQNYYLNNRKIVPRGNGWVYEDDGTEAK
jgi:hypothetical protein